jgi:hypothetical protein
MTDDIHDTSRIDSFMASRRRAMFLHAVWRPMLAGAAGAAIIVATVWAASPRFHYNDVEIPRVIVHDLDITVDHVVPRDVPIDHVVPHDVPVDHYVPRDMQMPGPQASASTKLQVADLPKPTAKANMGPQSPYAAETPEENKFVDQPEYKDARYHGRIVKSIDGNALSFADGKNFLPYHWDEAAQMAMPTPDLAFDSEELVGDLAMCTKGEHDLMFCRAMHGGQEVSVHGKPAVKRASATPTVPCPSTSQNGMPILVCGGPTTAAETMVNVMVDVDGYPVTAMVDTGCSWPMSIPEALADLLVGQHRAARTTSAKSTLADGSTQDTRVVVIDYIKVDGRHLRDVVAAIAPNGAPVLLGLGALNRLGDYHIADSKLVFTGSQRS